MFNMQSGMHRQSFPSRLPKSGLAKRSTVTLSSLSAQEAKHTKAVTGLMIDNLNRTVVSCGLDGKVKVRHSHPIHLPHHTNIHTSSGICSQGH